MKMDFELSTQRLILRPFKTVDLLAHLTAVQESTEQLSPWLEWCTPHYDQHDAHEWIASSRLSWKTDMSYELAIFDRFDDAFIGSVSISALIPMCNSANLGYWVRTSYHRQGIASEACLALAQFAFMTLGLTRLEIIVHPDNYPSQKTDNPYAGCPLKLPPAVKFQLVPSGFLHLASNCANSKSSNPKLA
jgi:RimJ/RimL family protein N-acetyltransferase